MIDIYYLQNRLCVTNPKFDARKLSAKTEMTFDGNSFVNSAVDGAIIEADDPSTFSKSNGALASQEIQAALH